MTDSGLSNPVPPNYPTAMFLRLNGINGAHDLVNGRAIPLFPPSGLGAVVYDLAVLPGGDVVICGRYRGASSFDGQAVPIRGLNDGFVARYATGSTLVWLQTFGGSLDDECTSIALGVDGDILMAVNHASSNVAIGGVPLTPAPAGLQKSAIVRLKSDGSVVWARDFAATSSSRIGEVAFGANGDVFYAGFHEGSADLGDGIPTLAAPTPTFFVVRRAP